MINQIFIAIEMATAQRKNQQYQFYLKADQLVYEAMSAMGFSTTNYAIGGSVALIAYNVDIERVPHDVDVIVPNGLVSIISKFVICDKFNRFTFVPYKSSRSSYSFKYKDIIIDVLEQERIEALDVKQRHCCLNTLENIIKIKQQWGRAKDIIDLAAIRRTYPL